MGRLIRENPWMFVLVAVLFFTTVVSLPSPLPGHHVVYDVKFDLDHPSLGPHRRQPRRTGRGEALATWDCGRITAVPDEVRTGLPLDEFYQKFTHAYGIPVVSSNASRDAALTRACYAVRFLLADRQDLRDAMHDQYGRVGVIAQSERTTEIPEHSYLSQQLDDRARGLGGTPSVPVSTDGEENILCLAPSMDRWFEEDILIHEFAHAIHLISLNWVDPSFDSDLRAAYDMAKADDLWSRTYAISKPTEYFAEGVQAFFGVQVCRGFIDEVHNHVCTRDLLRDYDPRLYDLIAGVFPCMNTVVDRCDANQTQAATQELRMNCDVLPTPTVGTSPASSTTVGPTSVEQPQEFCLETTIVDAEVGSLTWPRTSAGSQSQSIEVCPLDTQRAGLPRGVRNCSLASSEWDTEYEVGDCGPFRDPSNITLEVLAKVVIGIDNVVEVSRFLANLTTVGPSDLRRPNLTLVTIAEVLQNIVAAGSGKAQVADAVSHTVDSVMIGLPAGRVLDTGDPTSRPSIAKSLQAQVDQTLRLEGAVSIRRDSVQVEAVSLNRSEAAMSGLGFASVGRGGSNIEAFLGPSKLSDVRVSVQLPGSELEPVDAGDGCDQSKLRVSFIVYRDDTLFQSPLLPGIAAGGAVVALAVQDMVLRNLDDPVRIQYKTPADLSEETLQKSRCVFWDFSLKKGVGDWSEDGCVLAEVTNEVIACHCDHLTNFAVLVGVADMQQALNVASQMGCVLCIIFLCVTLVANICVGPEDDRQEESCVDRSHPIFMQLCVSLLVMYVVFVAGVYGAKGSKGGCVFVAALLHYLTLVSVMVLTWEARDLYRSTAGEGPVAHKRFQFVRNVVLAWGIPLIIIAIAIPVELSYYKGNNDDSSSSTMYCFLKPGLPMYLFLLLPTGLFLAHNITVWVLVVGGCPKTQKRYHWRLVPRRMQNAIGIAALTLLTWLFGILAITSEDVAYHIVFLLTSTSQGVFIFIAFCVRRRKVREGALALLRRHLIPGSSCLHVSDPEENAQPKSAQPGTELKTLPSIAIGDNI